MRTGGRPRPPTARQRGLRRAGGRDLQLALALADAADVITMAHFQSATLSVRTKSDHTPVSEADEAVERMIRDTLAKERPGDAIVGEEFGSAEGARRWIIDPIDATKNYIRGIPVFATLIALENEVGVVSAPALQRRWWAARGQGAFCNGRPIHVSTVATIEEASLAFDDVSVSDARIAFFRRFGRARGFGDFWGHMLVAEGAMDVCFEPQVSLWDVAAIKVIVEEAGGRFDFPATSTNGLLHDAVLEALR
jgi:histidinol-phosphatase